MSDKLWTFVLQESPPFKPGQPVLVYGYRCPSPGALEPEAEPDTVLRGTIAAAWDSPLVAFGGVKRFFQPYHRPDGGLVLACVVEV